MVTSNRNLLCYLTDSPEIKHLTIGIPLNQICCTRLRCNDFVFVLISKHVEIYGILCCLGMGFEVIFHHQANVMLVLLDDLVILIPFFYAQFTGQKCSSQAAIFLLVTTHGEGFTLSFLLLRHKESCEYQFFWRLDWFLFKYCVWFWFKYST